ncbi:MAG TPA: ribonuclease Y [Anaerolineales bacterium]|nr:ribonuclease Y [Anaerolineales bacterium]
MDIILNIIFLLVGLGAGAAGGFYYKQYLLRKAKEDIDQKVDQIMADAQKKAREMEVAAKDKAIAIRQEADTETEKKRAELRREDDRLQRRRVELDKNIERIEKREQTLNKRQSQVDRRANEIDKLYSDQLQKLEEVAAMSRDDARGILLAEVEKEARSDMARIIRQIEAEAKEEGDRRARDLIALAIQRVASEHVNEITTSTVPIPSEEMKGRIIGRNGRNIRAFEQAAGVDVIVDDTPEAVTISCFDPVRREVARRALGKLILDGRIHPAHIEKVLKKEQDEVDRTIVEAGEQATFDAGVPGLPSEIIKVLGRLKYRTSYGQNQLFHAVETARLSAVIASELGADVETAKMGGLLHDLGKAIDHNVEGTHAGIGADLARRYRLPPKVINAIAAHHHEVEQESVEAIIVEAADAISGARPGARRESLEDYIKRVRALEDIANSFKGVRESFALQAGREVRIIVKPEQVDDLESVRIARDIAKQIEENMQYPGQIRVTVIRETRAVDYAK